MDSPHRRCDSNPNWRPKKTKEDYYSGKKKQHTLKAQVIVHWKTGLILDVQTSKGSIYDFNLYKDTCPDWLPCDAKLLADNDYQGIAKLHEQSLTPFKKPRGGHLLELCKQANQYLAKCRILVEHKIGLIKLFKIVAQRYRNRCQRYDLRMKLFAGLVNFELKL